MTSSNKAKKGQFRQSFTMVKTNESSIDIVWMHKTNIQKLIDALVEIKSRGIELTMDGMITMLDNNLDAEKKQLKECWETAHQAGRFEGKGIAEENWQAFDDYYNEC